jgi:hypothetical protein
MGSAYFCDKEVVGVFVRFRAYFIMEKNGILSTLKNILNYTTSLSNGIRRSQECYSNNSIINTFFFTVA